MKKKFFLSLSLFLFLFSMSDAQNFPKIRESDRINRLDPPKGKTPISDYLLKSTVEFCGGHDYWSKVIWDVTAVAWLVNSSWLPTNLDHSPVLTDQVTYSIDHTRHFIRMATSLNRDVIFRDLFSKLSARK